MEGLDVNSSVLTLLSVRWLLDIQVEMLRRQLYKRRLEFKKESYELETKFESSKHLSRLGGIQSHGTE